MQVTFDPEGDSLERVIALVEALYDVELRVDDASERKMRH